MGCKRPVDPDAAQEIRTNSLFQIPITVRYPRFVRVIIRIDRSSRRQPPPGVTSCCHFVTSCCHFVTSCCHCVTSRRRLLAATLQLELVGNLGCDVLEADGGAGDPLEADAVEREPGQLAHLDLPLDEGLGLRVAVHAQEQEALSLLVVAVVCVQDLKRDKMQMIKNNIHES